MDLAKLLLSQFIRHLVTALAAMLGAYGVTADQQTAFVSSTTAVLVAVLMALGSQLLAYVSKQRALQLPPKR